MRRIVFEPGPTKLTAGAVHDLNLRAALTAIASTPNATAADAGRATGLSPATTSRLVDELLQRQLILEGDRVRGKRGQPGVSLRLNPRGAFSAGCQVGYSSGYMFLRSVGGEVLAEQEFAITQCESLSVSRLVAEAFERIMGGQPDEAKRRFVALGVAIPADYARLSGKIGEGKSQGSWDDRSFHRELSQALGRPVTIYSSGSAGAWAELAAMVPPRPADYLYLFVDEFLQSGLLLDGRLWVGPQADSSALGRMPVGAQEGIRLYDVAGGYALAQLAKLEGAEAAEGHWLTEAARALATACEGVSGCLALPLIIVDGTLPALTLDKLTAALEKELPRLSWSSPPHVRRGVSGERAPAKGAALRPLYTSFFSDDVD